MKRQPAAFLAIFVFCAVCSGVAPQSTLAADSSSALLWAGPRVDTVYRFGCESNSIAYVAMGDCRMDGIVVFDRGLGDTFVFNAASFPTFACLVAGLTNGVDNRIGFGTRTSSLYARVQRGLESEFGIGSPDLQGMLVDDIRAVFTVPECRRANIRWEIWGQTDVGQPIAAMAAPWQIVYPNQPVTLSVVLDRADAATLEPGIGAIDPAGGTVEVAVTEETTFTLTASNDVGTQVRQVTLRPQTPTVTFDISAPEIFAGRDVTLSWQVDGGEHVSIAGVAQGLPAEGSVVVTPPQEHTTYTLQASNVIGGSEAQVSVDWKLPIARMVLAPEPFPGDPFNIYIVAEGADTLTLEPGFGALEPTTQTLIDVTVEEDTVFTLTATNPLGSTVAVLPARLQAPRITLSAEPARPVAGEPVVLGLTIDGADEATLAPWTGEIAPADTSLTLEVNEPTTFVLTASNAAGTSTRSVAVTPQPIVHFAVDPPFVEPGGTVKVSWEVLPFANASIDSWGSLPHQGSRTLRPLRSMTLTLRADAAQVQQVAEATLFIGRQDISSVEVHFTDQGLLPDAPPFEPGVPFDVYVLGVRPDAGVAAYEFQVDFSGCLTVLERRVLQESVIDVGIGDDNWIVGLRQCELDEVFTPLVRYKFMASDEQCLRTSWVHILPSTPSSFSPPTPGYLTCGWGRELREFLPFYVPPRALLVNLGSSVPVRRIPLRGTATAEGIDLRWGVLDFRSDRLQVFRANDDGPSVEVQRWTGTDVVQQTGWLDPVADGTYSYRVVARADGADVVSEVVEVTAGGGVPRVTALLPNVPNPFNPSTQIRYRLAATCDVRLDIFNAAGRRVRTEGFAHQIAGDHSWTWDGNAQDGIAVGSGVYYVRLGAAGRVFTQRIALLR